MNIADKQPEEPVRLQFSLRTLLIVTTGMALAVSAIVGALGPFVQGIASIFVVIFLVFSVHMAAAAAVVLPAAFGIWWLSRLISWCRRSENQHNTPNDNNPHGRPPVGTHAGVAKRLDGLAG